MALMLTHPDYMVDESRHREYRSFLEHVRENDDGWHALPHEVAEWWRTREASEMTENAVSGPASDRATIRRLTVSNDGIEFVPSP